MKGMAAGAAARIFPITRPFANSLSRFGGTPKLCVVYLVNLNIKDLYLIDALADIHRVGLFQLLHLF